MYFCPSFLHRCLGFFCHRRAVTMLLGCGTGLGGSAVSNHTTIIPQYRSSRRLVSTHHTVLAPQFYIFTMDQNLPHDQVTLADRSETSTTDLKGIENPTFDPPKRFYWAFLSLSVLALASSFSLTSLSIAVVVGRSILHRFTTTI